MMANEHELHIERLIKAPVAQVWEAWQKPEHLAQWWIPAPMECKVVKLDLRPGGGFETLMREGEGDFGPHVEGCFLDVVPQTRLVWSTVLREGWQPIEPWLALTAIISFEAVDGGTRYASRVLHRSPEDAAKHSEMGFEAGWGTVIDQLASFVAR